MNDDTASALRPLRAVEDATASLRAGVLDGERAREAVLQVAGAVEASLRRLLRDDASAPLTVRLRALAPEELRSDEVLAEVRQHDRISIELAAAVHELFEVRRSLRHGNPLAGGDAALALRTVERLETEIHRILERQEPAREAAPPPPPAPGDETVWAGAQPAPASVPASEPLSPAASVPLARRPRVRWAAGALSLIILVSLVLVWQPGSSDSAQLEQGIALFRSGSYEDAAAYFWRYAEANPDDPTPHLYLARIHRRTGRFELAAQELEKAAELAPEDADVHQELGFLLLDTGRYDVAVERFRSALRLDPEGAGSWIGLVRALRAAGRNEAAERVLARAPSEVRERLSRAGGPAAELDP